MRDKKYPHIEANYTDTKDENYKDYYFACNNCKNTSNHVNFSVRAGTSLHKKFIKSHKDCKPLKQNT